MQVALSLDCVAEQSICDCLDHIRNDRISGRSAIFCISEIRQYLHGKFVENGGSRSSSSSGGLGRSSSQRSGLSMEASIDGAPASFSSSSSIKDNFLHDLFYICVSPFLGSSSSSLTSPC